MCSIKTVWVWFDQISLTAARQPTTCHLIQILSKSWLVYKCTWHQLSLTELRTQTSQNNTDENTNTETSYFRTENKFTIWQKITWTHRISSHIVRRMRKYAFSLKKFFAHFSTLYCVLWWCQCFGEDVSLSCYNQCFYYHDVQNDNMKTVWKEIYELQLIVLLSDVQLSCFSLLLLHLYCSLWPQQAALFIEKALKTCCTLPASTLNSRHMMLASSWWSLCSRYFPMETKKPAERRVNIGFNWN